MEATLNRQIRLASRPTGAATKDNFRLTEEPVAAPRDGEAVVKILYLSLDPAMRGWMNEGKSYIAPVEVGAVMRALSVGVVVESKSAKVNAGDYVIGTLGAQEYAAVQGETLRKIDPRLAPLPLYLSALGMPGMTAYFGILDVGQINPGEEVLISGAAGAVGAIAGQIARITGCRVVGTTSSPEKCRYLTDELGFHGAIDYKAQPLKQALKQNCPDGIDVFFDNVGGEILDVALTRIKRRARIVICGAISQYNTAEVKGPSNYLSLLVNRARMEGMVVFDYADKFGAAAKEMAGWLANGQLKSRGRAVFIARAPPKDLSGGGYPRGRRSRVDGGLSARTLRAGVLCARYL